MKVKAIADKLQVTPSTVRNWCREFSEFLSPTAAPGAGVVRSFNESDFAVLASVASWKSSGAVYSQIRDMLAAGELADIPTPEPAPPPEAQEVRTLVVPLMGQLDRMVDSLRQDNADLRTRNAELERRCAKLEASAVYYQKSLLDRIFRR